MRWREKGPLRWLEAELPEASAVFSTRLGGVSAGPFESLNLGILTGDEPGAVGENRGRLAAALGRDPSAVVIGRQVHGAELSRHSGPQRPAPYAEPGSPIPEVDGHLIGEPGLAALVFVADCLPVALAGSRGTAILHCGWRGLAAGIIARAAAAIEATAAAIGPGIGSCCYEVGPEVLEALSARGSEVADGRWLDLAAVTSRLLEAAGVGRLELAGLCTSCESELFFSARRDRGRTGRQAGVVWSEARAS